MDTILLMYRWGDGIPGTLEAAITGPGVYRLEAGKVYLTLEHIPVESGEVHCKCYPS